MGKNNISLSREENIFMKLNRMTVVELFCSPIVHRVSGRDVLSDIDPIFPLFTVVCGPDWSSIVEVCVSI